jgi:hypothetical protein
MLDVDLLLMEQFIVCHTFQCANQTGRTKVYMETAILPVRYEIENTDTTADASTLKQICSTVISEGGYQQTVQDTIARRTAILGTISTTTFYLLYLLDLNQQLQVQLYY